MKEQILDLLLPFGQSLKRVNFLRRYKRFFVDVVDQDGGCFAVHCANSGSMKSCLLDNAPAYIFDSQNPSRKLPYSLELIELEDGFACVNTQRANMLVGKLLNLLITTNSSTRIPSFLGCEQFKLDFSGVDSVCSEVKFSQQTRFDFCLGAQTKRSWIEVKSVSLRLEPHVLAFPDAVTERGQKHILELSRALDNQEQAFLFFVIMRASNLGAGEVFRQFRPAHEIDPSYAKLLESAVARGVKVRVLVPSISTEGFGIRGYFIYG